MNRPPIVLPNEVLFAEVEDRLARGEEVMIPFKGRSMEPLLREGCSVGFSPVEGDLKENDIVLFRYADVLLMRAEAKYRLSLTGNTQQTCRTA